MMPSGRLSCRRSAGQAQLSRFDSAPERVPPHVARKATNYRTWLYQKHGRICSCTRYRCGPGTGLLAATVQVDVETQIQHPHIRLISLSAESRGVARCFDTDYVQLSIGPRLFLSSGSEQCSTLLGVCLISSICLIKDCVRM